MAYTSTESRILPPSSSDTGTPSARANRSCNAMSNADNQLVAMPA